MRALRLISVVCVSLSGSTPLSAQQPRPAPSRLPDLAVYSLTLSDSSDTGLRVTADSCVARLVTRLAAETLVVVRRPPIDLGDLRRACPARFAMIGKLARKANGFDLEWSLVEVESGDELRAYFAGPEREQVLSLGDPAAPRIAAAIRERVAEQDRPH